MRGKWTNLTGKKFGRLRAICVDNTGDGKLEKWLCFCDCGNEVVVLKSNLCKGTTRSCGCLRKESSESQVLRAHEGTRWKHENIKNMENKKIVISWKEGKLTVDVYEDGDCKGGVSAEEKKQYVWMLQKAIDNMNRR